MLSLKTIMESIINNISMNEEDKPLSPAMEKIKYHAQSIIDKGAPFTKEELKVLQIWNSFNGGKAFNAGKRSWKADNLRQIRGK